MKNTEWWRQMAQHMWRTYFAIRRQKMLSLEQPKLTPGNVKIWDICDGIFASEFVKSDQEILEIYFTSRWGDDLYVVEDYSLKHNIPTKVIWMVIKRANRLIAENIGILDAKEEQQDGKSIT